MSDEGQVVETIRATDLKKLFEVVEAAAGLFNALEQEQIHPHWSLEFLELGDKLRELGLKEIPIA